MKTGFACPPQIIGAGAVALAWLLTLQPRPAFPQTPGADSFNPGAIGASALAIQPDGKVLVGGGFGTLAGQPCNGFGRLNADGTFDSSFNGSASGPEGHGCNVNSIEVQADGKILVGGTFTVLDGEPRSCLGRLNADGTLDSEFNPGVGLANQGPGASPSVVVLAVQADGKVLVGGNFTSLAGQPCTRFGRLNPSGTLDTSFAAENTASEAVSLAFQPDGKILVGGSLYLDGGQSSGIGRLNADGSWDNQFSPQTNPVVSVSSIAVQTDGRILLGGSFGTLDGQPRHNIARLNADGTVDPSFNPGADGQVCSLVAQANGQILVGGAFQTLGGQPRSYLGRLNPDGTADTLFNPGVDGWVQALAVQADGNVLVAGSFQTLAGADRLGLGRLVSTETATQALSYDGSTITWLRGGSSPEVWRTQFEVSTDGVNLTLLGEGSRVPGGWQLAGASVPPSTALVALGFVAGGECDDSGWYVEASIGRAVFIDLPASRTNSATTIATFNAVASGSGPLAFRWLKDGAPLADGGNVSGAQTTALALGDVLHADTGNYGVVVSNAFGSVTSTAATLTVIEPEISTQPASQSVKLGQSAAFAVKAAGTPPFTYQWWKDGVELAGGTKSSLALTNASAASAGNYWVVVSGPYGSVTSAVAGLTVNLATLDSAFQPWHGNVYALALQPDGKILTGYSAALQRLNADGTLDGGFSASAAGENETVHALAVQADGKILVGGSFTKLDGHALSAIGRLNSDGTLDTQFDPAPTADPNPAVNTLALEPDGELLAAGNFNTLAGWKCTAIGLLNPDGSLDNLFNSAVIAGSPTCLAVEADGKVLEAGGIVSGCQLEYPLDQPVPVVMNADGSLDTDFAGWVGAGDYCIIINCLVVQPDGKILMGGSFGNADGQSCSNVCRFYPDGTLDTGFNPSPNGEVCSLALQADGKILVGGTFTAMGGQSRNYLARLNPDGTLDSQFNPGGADGYGGVYSLALQADGKILVGGGSFSLGGQAGSGYWRLNNLDAAAQSLAYDGSTITWLRGGSSPEVWCTTFEASTNGTVWTMLGQGSRIPGGWQLAFVLVPPGGTIRARGYYSTGGGNASTSLLEALLSIPGPPVPRILLSGGYFGFRENGFGFSVSGPAGQAVAVDGSGNLSDWLPLATNTLGSGPFYFSDPAAKEQEHRFYRARIVP